MIRNNFFFQAFYKYNRVKERKQNSRYTRRMVTIHTCDIYKNEFSCFQSRHFYENLKHVRHMNSFSDTLRNIRLSRVQVVDEKL